MIEPKISLNFMCMNPGVSFRPVAMSAKSVILASGTLSPMKSFQSELQTQFGTAFEANHVIDSKQIWVKCIRELYDGNAIIGNFQNSESYSYQDGIGEIVLDILKTIPFGVLCFVPSYNFLAKMIDRWKNTGLYSEMSLVKRIFLEPKAASAAEFDGLLTSYKNFIDQVDENSSDSACGALLFAVFRGRASEGIDFPDNYCRAVISLGIPYPFFKDKQVMLKKEYNNQFHFQRQLLPGHDWYDIQAFRALNQALGRCIRHKNDWGAIVLLDSRFADPKNRESLSKWIRNNLEIHQTWDEAVLSLKTFTDQNMQRMAELEGRSQISFGTPIVCKKENDMIEVQSSSEEDLSMQDLEFKIESISMLHDAIRKKYRGKKIIICVNCGKQLYSVSGEVILKKKVLKCCENLDSYLHPASIMYMAPSLSDIVLQIKRSKFDTFIEGEKRSGQIPMICSCSSVLGQVASKLLYFSIATVGIKLQNGN